MLLFCPICGTMLMFERGETVNEFKCYRCEYAQPISGVVTSRMYTKQKSLAEEAVAGEDEANAQLTEVTCPECFHTRAYFTQMQTRSADEPMTVFYKCAKPECRHRWKE